jgi:hypothetical protein
VVKRGLDRIKAARGESTTGIKGLAMERTGRERQSGF